MDEAERGWRRWGRAGAALALVAAAAVACSRGGESSSTAARAPGAPAEAPAGAAADASAASAAGGAAGPGFAAKTGAPPSTAAPASLKTDALDAPTRPGGQFISSASLTVQVGDVTDAKPRAVEIAERAGGSLFGDDSTYGPHSRAVVTLKVPPAAFGRTLDELGRLGTPIDQKVRSDDVTGQVVDLDARITAIAASVERTRELLGRAQAMSDIVTLEGELARRQGELESLRGQQRTLRDRIDLATVVVTLQADAPAPAPAPEEDHLPGFLDGLRGGGRVAVAALSYLAATAGALLPFVPLALVAVVALRLWRSRRTAAPAPRPVEAV